jgi:hypothetical protein
VYQIAKRPAKYALSIATDYPKSFTVASTTIPQDDVEREPDGCRSKRKSIDRLSESLPESRNVQIVFP